MRTLCIFLLAVGHIPLILTQSGSGCESNVDEEIYYRADDHWIVPVGWVFEAEFSFSNTPPYFINVENNAPGAYEEPEIPRVIETRDYTVGSRYNCTDQTRGAPGEYLHLEYGFEKPESGYCDTRFECCDVGCEFVVDDDNPTCGSMFSATIQVAACPDARVQVTELTESRADIVNIERVWRDGDSITVQFVCPEFRNDGAFIEIMVEDQYGGIDTCSMEMECQSCLKTCGCPMCAPPDKAWVCYADGDGDIALYAMTAEEIEASEDRMFYPTEVYKGTQYDCYCEPIIDFPPDGSAFICHYDESSDNFLFTSVQVESRSGPLNDLEDYLDLGDGFPGEYSEHPRGSGDNVYLDGWCQIVS